MILRSSNPYIGPRTFLKEEGHLFFGREREANDLIALVASEQLVLFYAQSGAGKSSLINTRLIPYLESKAYEVLPIGRISGDWVSGIDIENIYIFNLFRNLDQHETDLGLIEKLSLSGFLGSLNKDEKGYFYDESPWLDISEDGALGPPSRRALIIDQFEELFSTHPEAWNKREDFFRQLAQAMHDDPYLWVVLVMREDYIAALDPYAHLLPNGLRVRYYMQRLGREAALQAIKRPVQDLRPYADGVAEKLVEDLSKIKVQKPDGVSEIQSGQYVEPVQLQVVCYSMWGNLPPEGSYITEIDLQEIGNVDESLGKYYAERVQAVAMAKNVKERLIREWFEKKLITSEGIRNLVLQDPQGKSGDLDDDIIQAFQSDLVRLEQHGETNWYELTHDRLVQPIIINNKAWFDENLSPLQRQAALWKDQDKNESWLLRGKALAEVKQRRKDYQEELTDTEKEFLEASRSLVKREQRLRWLNRSIAILGLVAIILAIFTYRATLEAKQQARVSLARQLAAQSVNVLDEYPVQSMLLAIEANLSRESGEQRVAAAEESLRASLKYPHGIPLPDQKGSVNTLAFSPDGHWLATGSDDRSVYLWNMDETSDTSEPLKLTGHTDKISALAFSPDSHWLATGSYDKTARLWDLTVSEPSKNPKILSGHEREITAIAFSPDGHWLATGSSDETARLWDLTAHDPTQQPRILNTSYGWIHALAFSPDGNWLATGGAGGTVELWDIGSADSYRGHLELEGHSASVLALAFSPDGKWLATGSADKTAQLWNLKDLNLTHSLGNPLVLPHFDKVDTLVFQVEEGVVNFLATGAEDGSISLWNLQAFDPTAYPILLPGHTGSITALALSPDGRWLASGSKDHHVRIWDLNSPTPALASTVLSGHDAEVNTLAFSPDGHWLASGGQDGSIRLWDQIHQDRGVNPIVMKGHQDDINALAFSPDGRWLATGSADNTARLWDLHADEPARKYKVLSGHTSWIQTLAFSPDGRWLATGSGDDTIRLWDLTVSDPEKNPYILSGHKEWIRTLAFSPDGHWLATGSADDTTQLWDLSSGKASSESIVLDGHHGDIYALAFSPDGKWLATGAGDNIVRLWDLSSPDEPQERYDLRGHKDNILTLAFSPDGHWLATGSGGGDPTVFLWDMNTPDPSANPKKLAGHEDRITTLVFSPDNHWMASGSADHTVRLWNLEDLNSDPKVLYADKVNTIAFSLDGNWLAAGGDNGIALLWDLTASHPEEEPIRLSDHQGPVETLAFSPDSRWLATGSGDNTARLWLVKLNDLESLACQIAGRNLKQEEWDLFLSQEAYQRTCEQWP